MDKAKSVLDLALSIHPDNANLILKRAKSMVFEGHYQDALEYMDIYFSEYDFDLYLLKIECYLQLKLKAEAALQGRFPVEEKDGDLTEDDLKNEEKLVQKRTDDAIVEIDKIIGQKEAEILEV